MLNYSQLEWLGNNPSTYSTSYIELNYYPSSATKIEVDAAFLSTGNGIFIFGIFSNNAAQAYWAVADTSQMCFSTYRSDVSSKVVHDYHNYRDSVKRTYTFGNGYIMVNGSTTATATTQSYSSFGYKLKWFAGCNSWGGALTQKVYGIRIYDNDTIVRDYIPAIRLRDRAIGLLETITNEFHVAPSGYTRGKILEKYTENMALRVGFDESDVAHYFISENSVNFKAVDSNYSSLSSQDIALNALVEKIEKRFSIDSLEKEAIWKIVNNKIDIVENKDVVLNTLITKLDSDYSKEKLDAIFASNDDLETKIEATCDELMTDYYTKAEVDKLVEKGGGGKMDNYYTKTEIDEKIPDKEDLTIIQQFLESRTEYYNSLRTFTKLNGKGE